MNGEREGIVAGTGGERRKRNIVRAMENLAVGGDVLDASTGVECERDIGERRASGGIAETLDVDDAGAAAVSAEDAANGIGIFKQIGMSLKPKGRDVDTLRRSAGERGENSV